MEFPSLFEMHDEEKRSLEEVAEKVLVDSEEKAMQVVCRGIE
jgi:hypothetical protein